MNSNGKRNEPVLFLYYVPATGCPIKEKMLYSASKGTFRENMQNLLGSDPKNEIIKSLEIDSAQEMSTNALNDSLGVNLSQVQPTFGGQARRPAPPGRGARRIITAPNGAYN